MATPAETCLRLLVALEDLVRQEAASLFARDFAAVARLQERAGLLVAYLGEHGPAVADEPFRARIAECVERRSAAAGWLGGEIDRTRLELIEIDSARRRASRIAPAYGRSTAGSRLYYRAG
jgi:hypothetical protein